jgi:hypothetical protein
MNSSLHAPSAWTFAEDLKAASGASTFAFGVSGTTPGTDDWASGTAQSASVRADLYPRYDSWNVVSMTGGADDSNWRDKLADFYYAHFVTASPAPWAVSTSSPSADCPDSQSVWDWLHATQLDGETDDQHIQDNLGGIVTVATRYSPGVRVLNVGYPYVVDQSNSCSADSGTWHGSKSVIDDLNADHQAISGANVTYVDLTGSSGFGSSPVSGGYLQLNRLYGYPHPNDAGQSRMADIALAELTAKGAATFSAPSADTYVDSNHTATNYGTANPLWATSGSTRSFLRFNTNGAVPSGSVATGATLKIYVTNNSVTSGGFEVHPEDDSWTESGTTWSNQPTWSSTVLATSGTPASGTWLSIDLPASAVNVNGDTSLGLRYTVSGSNAQLASREDSGHKPQLTINYASTTTLNPTGDTYVDTNHSGTNYGTANPLWATSSGTRALVRFNTSTSGIAPSGSSLASAVLKLYVTNNSVTSGGFEVHPEDDSWTESGTTWSNQPTWSTTTLATSGTPGSGQWVTITLPVSAVNTTGNTSVGLIYTVSGANTQFSSREDSAHKPQLILTWH